MLNKTAVSHFLKSDWFKKFLLGLALLLVAALGLCIILSVITIKIKIQGPIDTTTNVEGIFN